MYSAKRGAFLVLKTRTRILRILQILQTETDMSSAGRRNTVKSLSESVLIAYRQHAGKALQ